MLDASEAGTFDMIKLSAWMAIAVGGLIAVAQLARNLDNWANWTTWMVDEAAAAVLLVAGLLALRKQTTRLLPVGWSFAAGLYAAGLVSHWNAMQLVGAELYASEQRLTFIVGAILALCLVGVALVLLAPREARD
jgi:hypothetical protein